MRTITITITITITTTTTTTDDPGPALTNGLPSMNLAARNSIIPNPGVIMKMPDGRETYVDLYTRMLKENIVFLGTPINDDVANVICGQLLYLEAENPDREISIYINSPGGDINALLAIYDTMQYVRNEITTLCYGQAASAAAVLLAAGTPGKRMALPNSRILIHQPYAQSYGQASDVELAAAEIMRLKSALETILARHTGQSAEKIAADTDRDNVMTADDAKAYGLIDEVLLSRELVDNTGPITALK